MEEVKKQKVCAKCFSSFEDILSCKLIGCSNCYITFEKELEKYIRASQNKNLFHLGKKWMNN